jgi:hypothetical protein
MRPCGQALNRSQNESGTKNPSQSVIIEANEKGQHLTPDVSLPSSRVRPRWFLTVDWCSKGKRGIFCNKNGNSFSQETQHTEDEIWNILGPFDLVLAPLSVLLSEEELKEYHLWTPLAEYKNEYGVACRGDL